MEDAGLDDVQIVDTLVVMPPVSVRNGKPCFRIPQQASDYLALREALGFKNVR